MKIIKTGRRKTIAPVLKKVTLCLFPLAQESGVIPAGSLSYELQYFSLSETTRTFRDRDESKTSGVLK